MSAPDSPAAPDSPSASNKSGLRTATWPRAYLLSIFDQAIKHGYVLLTPISEKQAQSLRLALVRQRRRADTTNARFIPDEYHLVTPGAWSPGPDNLGRMAVVYNTTPPDEEPLPPILPGDGAVPEDVLATLPRAVAAANSPADTDNSDGQEPSPLSGPDIDEYLDGLLSKARKDNNHD